MSMKVHMKGKNAAERAGDLKLIRVKILDLPADTVAHLVECRHNELKAWV